ncbi:tRNA-dihydrouridine(20) synthase [NAD(P)+]-like [Corticium candelabrum]|uniref:tRNA-dihydrouridine(20) synthase [NAD(P)+]-like n=1 Tax=Corticium candelabrum TaxID=121492 RepID=UPI002E25851C|nr:tRNA-dihydrouridine(20) synthase [NAD(P)+]-like [Corticium candelabrum]XP_062502007.1 tRNA-dihydrouridine(20) synthase [NAD(P)+]-like [Corticium candelabrum]
MVVCKRTVNDVLHTVDFVHPSGQCMFRTCEQEKGKVIFQLGTADPGRAVKVAQLVEKEVAGIDINMGCPKKFSVEGGMGAALLTNPDKVQEIVSALVKSVSIPVSCKIRILPTIDETVALAKVIEGAGAAALAVHGRLISERPQHKVHIDHIKAVAENISIPVIANGGSVDHINEYADIETYRQVTGASSVMIARAAQWNVSIFRKEGLLPVNEVAKAFLHYAVQYNSHYANVKYCLAQLLRISLESSEGKRLLSAHSLKEICAIWELSDYYDEVEKTLCAQEKELLIDRDCVPLGNSCKKPRLDADDSEYDICELPVRCTKIEINCKEPPKTQLYCWTVRHRMKTPFYQTVSRESDRQFKSTVTVGDKKYSSSLWCKSKKLAEQSAATVCLTMNLQVTKT